MAKSDFGPYQAVTLVDDPAFLGYVVGPMVDANNQPDGRTMISIKHSGQTGLQGDRPVPTTRLVALDAVRPNSAPIRPRARRRANLHTAPQGGLP